MTLHYNMDWGSFDFSDLGYSLQGLWNAILRFLESPSFGSFIVIFGIFAAIFSVVGSIVWILRIVANWMIYDKAGEPGWAAIIPFFNSYTLYKLTWGSGWYFLLLFIPVVNVVIDIITMVKLAKVFGKGGGWACGLIFLRTIFTCITAFDKNIQYVGAYKGDYSTYTGDTQNASFYKNAYYTGPTDTGTASEQSAKKFCPECGAEVHAGDKFCMKCGKQL